VRPIAESVGAAGTHFARASNAGDRRYTLGMSQPSDTIDSVLRPGQRVRITQQVAARHYTLTTPIEGVVVRIEQKQTGSWFTHARNNRLWLDRVVIRRDDGEIMTLNIDPYTHVEVMA
jgi:hypothetical protein